MRTEKDIVNLANTWLNVCDSSIWGGVAGFDPKMFFSHAALSTKLYKLSSEMKPGTLGEIIALGIDAYTKSDFRRTSVSDLFPKAHPYEVKWTGESGGEILRQMAVAVIVATMYDILATEYFLRLEKGRVSERFKYYWPKTEMVKFVLAHRQTRTP